MIGRILRWKNNKRKQKDLALLQKKGLLSLSHTAFVKDMSLSLRGSGHSTPAIEIGEGSIINGLLVCENGNGSIRIGKNTFIGPSKLISIAGIEVGDNVLISWDCNIIDNDAHSLNFEHRRSDVKDWKKGLEVGVIGAYKNWDHVESSPIIIGDDVWIGFNSTILKGVTIGARSIVATGSTVTKDVPPDTLVAGSPAKVIRSLNDKSDTKK